jgi:hypothetical protein
MGRIKWILGIIGFGIWIPTMIYFVRNLNINKPSPELFLMTLGLSALAATILSLGLLLDRD